MVGTSPRTKRAPWGTLTVDRIVEAAIRIIDEEGLEAMTMSRLAAMLEVKTMSLYTHFRDKNSILKAANDAFLERLVLPTRVVPDAEHLRAVINAYFTLLVENPVILQFDASWEGTSETEARLNEELYACLAHLGIDTPRAIAILATLIRHTIGAAYIYPRRRKWDEDPDYWNRYRADLAELPEDTYPAMRRLGAEFKVYTQQQVFEFGLDMLLTAITGGTTTARSRRRESTRSQ